MSRHLVVFAKPPVAGRVKTRLAASIGPERAARLYAAFLEDTLSSHPPRPDLDRSIAWDAGADPLPDRAGWASFRQEGSDLGERLHAAFVRSFAAGARAVVVVGSDSPTLPASRVQDAFDLLRPFECVLGPSDDGGYYLVGLTRPVESLFRGVDWSTDRVLAQTLARAAQAGVSTARLDPWYDVDVPADLDRLTLDLARDPHLSPATRSVLPGGPNRH